MNADRTLNSHFADGYNKEFREIETDKIKTEKIT